MDYIFIDLGDNEFAHGLSYVALSRARDFMKILIDSKKFDLARFKKIFDDTRSINRL